MKVLLFCLLAGTLMACSGNNDEPTAVSGSEKDETQPDTTAAELVPENEAQPDTTADAPAPDTKTTEDTTAGALTPDIETTEDTSAVEAEDPRAPEIITGDQVCRFKEHYLEQELVTVGPDITVPDVNALTDSMPEVISKNLSPASFDSQWDRWGHLFSWGDDFTGTTVSLTHRSTDGHPLTAAYSYTYDDNIYENWCESGEAPCEVTVEYKEHTEEQGKIVANIFFGTGDRSLLLDFSNCD